MPFLGPVQIAYPSLVSLDITPNSITLVWPTSYFDVPSVVAGIHYDVIAANIFVTDAMGNANTITLPDATQSSPGSSFIITNIGASSFRLLRSDGSELIVIPNTPTTANSFFVVLTDTSTSAGGWQFVQLGAGTYQTQASTLAGNGLIALAGLLNTNIPVNKIVASPYAVLTSDRAKLLLWQTGIGILNLPAIATVGDGFYISFNNEGTGICTITPAMGGETIDNEPTLPLSPGQSLSLVTDGTDWWTVGLGNNTSAANFAAGSSLAPSITFTDDTTTGIYWYQNVFPPVTPPGIGFSVASVQIANITGTGLYTTPGKSITTSDLTNVASTSFSTNASYGQLGWNGPGLGAPATLRISGTNADTTMTLGPFAGLSFTESNANATITYNALTILSINNAGASIFPLDVSFSRNITVTLKSTFNGISEFNGSVTFNEPVTFTDTVTFNPAVPIASGGTGQSNQQAALNALMPSGAAIGDLVFRDATNNWVRLPIGTAGQVLTVVNDAGNLVPRWV